MAQRDPRTKSRRAEVEEKDRDVSMMDVKKEEDDDEIDQDRKYPNGHNHYGQPIFKRSPSSPRDPPPSFKSRSASYSPMKKDPASGTQTPLTEETTGGVAAAVGGDLMLKQEPGKPPKLSRTQSRKIPSRPAPLFLEEEDKTFEANASYAVIGNCEYQNKWVGQTETAYEEDEIECECEQAWDSATQTNDACGEDSDCINRATKIECVGDCRCGPQCQNRRFQLQQYANVTVFKTEKKGYGLRADADLRPNDFIYEYIGEVITEAPFERRRAQYDKEKIKHFYFMSLSKGEYIDATKKGNVGRFCNHSCNPNCYVDKWVVRDKLRMGIFAQRSIKAGEELTFDYNVDRYGADPQPCYCGEPNCSGFLGGKTQTERGTKLAHDVVEALGIEDGDDWDMAVPKKGKKRKMGEQDEEYVAKVQPKDLEEDAVSKVMSQLMQKKEKWIVVKLLQRIQTAHNETVFARVVKMHGYRIFRSILSSFQTDANVCLQVFDILLKLPRITRNKIHDSKIEEVVQKLKGDAEEEKVKEQASSILDVWSKLEMGYRIPRRLKDQDGAPVGTPPIRIDFDDRRNRQQKRERTESREPSPRRPTAPTGPRNAGSQRPPLSFRPSVARPPPNAPRGPAGPPLPDGWTEFFDRNTGKPYYHSVDGQTLWQRPTQPANIPPPPPKPLSESERLQQIINECVEQGKTPPVGASGAASALANGVSPGGSGGANGSTVDRSKDGWGSWPLDKCKKHYKGLIAPLAQRVASKYKDKIPKDRLKDWSKEIVNHITDRHFEKGIAKNGKELPRELRKKTEAQIKEFFEKARKKFEKFGVKNEERRRRREGEGGAAEVDSKREEVGSKGGDKVNGVGGQELDDDGKDGDGKDHHGDGEEEDKKLNGVDGDDDGNGDGEGEGTMSPATPSHSPQDPLQTNDNNQLDPETNLSFDSKQQPQPPPPPPPPSQPPPPSESEDYNETTNTEDGPTESNTLAYPEEKPSQSSSNSFVACAAYES